MFGGGEALAFARATAGNGLFPEQTRAACSAALPVQINGLDTLAVAAVKRLGRPIPFDRMGGGGAWIDFLGPPRHLRRVSFSDVAQGEVPSRALQGPDRRHRRDGAGAPGHAPGVVARATRWPGPRSTPTAIDTLLRGAPLRATGEGDNLAIALVLALLAPLLALLMRPWTGMLIALGAGLAVRGRRAAAVRRGLDPPGRRAARRAGASASSARCWSTGSRRRSSAPARATSSPASCPTPWSTRC